MRDLYAAFFRAANMPPDVVSRQRPKLLLSMLAGLAEDDEPDYENMPEHLKMFYGY